MQIHEDSYWAARLAIVAMRATCKGAERTQLGLYRMGPSGALVNCEEMASFLARLEKPVDCRPRIRAGALEIACRPLGTPRKRAIDAWLKGGSQACSGLLAFLKNEFGEDISQLPVLCLGRGEQLTLQVSAVWAFHREYAETPYTGFTVVGRDGRNRVSESAWNEDSPAVAALFFGGTSAALNLGISLPAWLFSFLKRR
jgi:hypothetical protein